MPDAAAAAAAVAASVFFCPHSVSVSFLFYLSVHLFFLSLSSVFPHSFSLFHDCYFYVLQVDKKINSAHSLHFPFGYRALHIFSLFTLCSHFYKVLDLIRVQASASLSCTGQMHSTNKHVDPMYNNAFICVLYMNTRGGQFLSHVMIASNFLGRQLLFALEFIFILNFRIP